MKQFLDLISAETVKVIKTFIDILSMSIKTSIRSDRVLGDVQGLKVRRLAVLESRHLLLLHTWLLLLQLLHHQDLLVIVVALIKLRLLLLLLLLLLETRLLSDMEVDDVAAQIVDDAIKIS